MPLVAGSCGEDERAGTIPTDEARKRFASGTNSMQSGIRNIIIAQLILTAAVAAVFLLWQGTPQAVAALYGGGIVLLNSFLLARRVRRAGDYDGKDVALAMYAGAALRFAITLAGFAIGMGVLMLAPVPQLVAFAAAQLGYVIAAKRQQP